MCSAEVAGFPGSSNRGASIAAASPGLNRWIPALIQIVASTTFMLIFRFPWPLILVFVAFILCVTLLSAWMKSRPPAPAVAQRSITHPTWFRIIGLGIALGAIVLFSIVLFGVAIFFNDWSGWQRYEGQRFHRADFQVAQTYFQKHKGGPYVYAKEKSKASGSGWICSPT
jgi:hypothetical protein